MAFLKNIVSKIFKKNKDKTVAVILCAGSGKRMGTETKKQFLEIGGKPVIYYALKAFEESSIDEIVIVTSADDIEYVAEEIVEKYSFNKVTDIIAGGKERYNSVFNGLMALLNEDGSSDCKYVFIHDGARPFVNEEIINRAKSAVKDYGTAVVGMPVKDTIKIVDENDYVSDTPDRTKVWQIQTPQCFEYELIYKAYSKLIEDEENGKLAGVSVTDDAGVVEKYTKKKVKLVKGSYENIKITTPEDMIVAEAVLKNGNIY